jgi:hypothetical protein
MDNKSKWIIVGIIAVALVVGLTLGAVAVTLIQRAVWGYPPAIATNFVPDSAAQAFPQIQGYQGYMMPRPMMRGGFRGGGPMMHQNYMGRGPRGFGPGMMTLGMGHGFGPMRGAAGPGWGNTFGSLTPTVAEQLDMTTAELTTELQSGKTIADLAQEKNVSLDTVVDTLIASQTERIQLSGKLTQEQADTMIEAMKANLTARLSTAGTPGACPGFGDTDGDGVCDFGGPGSRGGWGRGMMWR